VVEQKPANGLFVKVGRVIGVRDQPADRVQLVSKKAVVVARV
jgi:hypothetical protein